MINLLPLGIKYPKGEGTTEATTSSEIITVIIVAMGTTASCLVKEICPFRTRREAKLSRKEEHQEDAHPHSHLWLRRLSDEPSEHS